MLLHGQAALEVGDTKIADELINNILQTTYQGLSSKLKKVFAPLISLLNLYI